MQRKKIEFVPPVVVAKWSEEVLDEGFVPFPKRLVRCLDKIFQGSTAVDDIRIVMAIVDYRRPGLSRPPSYEFLAFTAGMTVEAFKERVKAMENQGLMKATGPDEVVTIEINGLLGRILDLTADEGESPY
jgi:hypothetical protein